MSYYPKSQITVNLYTSGGEYSRADNGKDYIGPYWSNSSNEYYTGKTPTDTPSVLLVPTNSPRNPDTSGGTNETGVLESNSISWQVITKYSKSSQAGKLPQKYTTLPVESDYELGEFQRYFTKKRNQNTYFEISKEDYKLLLSQDNQIQYQLYLPILLSWRISGDKNEVYNTNKNTVKLTENRLKLAGFTQYFKDNFTQYCQEDLDYNS